MRKYPFFYLICLAIAIVGGAVAQADQVNASNDMATPLQWLPAPLTGDGDVIMCYVERDGTGEGHAIGTKPASLASLYGILILYGNEAIFSQKVYYLFDNVNKTYFATKDFNRFLVAVNTLPDNAELDWVRSCTICCYCGMPAEFSEKLTDTLQRKHLNTGIEENTYPEGFCYCTATSVRFLDIPKNAGKEKGVWDFHYK